MGRISVGLLVAAGAVATSVAVPATPLASPVAAQDDLTLGKILWWDDFGSDTIVLGPNSSASVWLGQIDHLCDFIYPTADIYVVSGTPGAGGALTDVSGAPNVVFGSWGGGFSETIAITAPTGTLGPGTYSVVYDECQDGKLDAGVDAVFVDAITVAFPPGELPPIDPALQSLKGAARQAGTVARTALNAYAIYEALSEAYELATCVLGGLISCAISMAIDAATEYLQGALLAFLGLPDMKVVMMDLAEDVTRHWEGIAADPPDPAFQQLTVLGPITTVQPSDAGDFAIAEADWANALAVEAVLAEALLHAIERYQGADLADNPAWALQHLRQARNFATLLADHQAVTNAAVTDMREIVVTDPRDLTAIATAFEENRARVVASGFTPAELGLFASRGIEPAQVAEIEALYGGLPSAAGASRADLVGRLDAAISTNNATADSLRNFVAQLDSIEARLLTNVAAGGRPIADAGGPYATGVGTPVALDGTGSSDPAGSIASSGWDVDLDTQFDDATGLTPTVTPSVPYDGPIGLRVVDGDGNAAADYTRLTVSDANGAPTVAVVTPPVGNTTVVKGGTQTFTVTPSDPDGDPITSAWRVDGVVVGGNTTSFDFTDTATIGTHTVRYTASDGSGASRSVTWTISVVAGDADNDGWSDDVDCDDGDPAINPGRPEIQGDNVDENCDGTAAPEQNDPPAARDSSVGTPEDTPIVIPLIAPDPENDPVTFVITTPPTNGTLTGNGATRTYTPDANYSGPDSFTFSATDDEGLFGTATVSIVVTPLNDTPTAFPVSASGPEDTADIPVTLSADDADDDPLTFNITSGPSVGAFTGGAGADLTYTPPPDFSGTVTFTYTASDDDANTSNEATGTISIIPVNDPPTGSDQPAATNEDTPVTITPTIGDVDGDPLTLVVVTPPARGSVQVNTASFAYTPSPEFSGQDTFTYRVSDGNAVSIDHTVTVDVAPVNDPPTGDDVVVTVAEDSLVWIELIGSDPDSPLVFATTTAPANGTIRNLIGRRVLYEPGDEYSGPDSFEFTVTDGTTPAGPFTVSITVTPVNDPPAALDDRASTTGDQSVTVDVLANDTDAEGTALTLLSIGTPEAGNATMGAAPGTVVVTPPLGFTGAINVPYTVQDAGGAASTATITVVALPNAAVTETFTEVGQLGGAGLFNVQLDGLNDLIVVNKAQAFNRIWVAVSINRGTIVKLDTDSGQILGEYQSAPDGEPRNPSRTTVDQNGNVWATNRDGNSVYQIGLVENGQCVDRNSNGVIDTSTGQGDIRPWPGGDITAFGPQVVKAEDECILKYVKVSSSGTRHVSVTEDNDIWVSGTGNRIFDLIDGETGNILRTEGPVGYGGYGGLIDPNGVIWSATYPAELLRWDTSKPLSGPEGGNWEALPRGAPAWDSYGTCIDLFGNVWVTQLGSNTHKYAPDGTLLGSFPHGFGQAQGCAVDGNGDVWVAHSLNGGTTVGHLTNEGVFVGNVDVGSGPTGISVDSNGKIWSANYHSGTVSRIDPNLGPIHAPTGKHVGQVDFTSVFLNGNPYNYSDMTGSTLQGLPVSGTWSKMFDSTVAGTSWGAIDWHATLPSDSSIEVRVAVGDDQNTLGTGALIADGAPIPGTGRFANITVTLRRSGNGLSPTLHDLSLWTAFDPPPALTQQQREFADATDEDVPVMLDMSAVVPAGAPAGTQVVPLVDPLNGTLTRIDETSFTYTPDADYNGKDLFLYRVDDGQQQSLPGGAQITVDPVNDPPVANGQNVTTPEDTAVAVTLTGSDLEGDPLTFAIVGQPTNGTLTGTGANRTYTPNANFSGADSFTFRVNDGSADSALATVAIDVTPVNDLPVAHAQSVTTPEDTPLAITLTGADGDGSPLTFTVVGMPTNGVLSGTGANRTYAPNANFHGMDGFTFRVNDGTVDSALATVSIVVTSVNDLPVAVNDAATTNEDTPVAIPVLANDSDGDGGTLSVSSVATPGNGLATIRPDGQVDYQPKSNFAGQDSFTYTLSDGQGGVATATVSITVNPDVASNVPVEAGSLTPVAPGGAGAVAVLANLAMVNGLAAGYITADKCSSLVPGPQTKASGNHDLTYAIANLSVVPVDPDGRFCIYNQSPVDLIADVQGLFAPAGAGGLVFVPEGPVRKLDTRIAPRTKPEAGSITRVETGVAAGTVAVLVNLAMVDGELPGYITADKCSALVSGPQSKANGNHLVDFAIANLNVVPVDADGAFCIYNQNRVNLVVDLQGAFTTDKTAGLRFTSLPPSRKIDTREAPYTKPGDGTITRVETGVPAGTRAVLVNLAMDAGRAPGYITADKCSTLTPGTQTRASGNHVTFVAISNLSVVPVDEDGSFCVFNQTSVHVVVDLQGYFSTTGANEFFPVAPFRVLDTR